MQSALGLNISLKSASDALHENGVPSFEVTPPPEKETFTEVSAVHTQQQGEFPASSVIWESFICSVLGYRIVNSASSPNLRGGSQNARNF
jgi:hypothetical protein